MESRYKRELNKKTIQSLVAAFDCLRKTSSTKLVRKAQENYGRVTLGTPTGELVGDGRASPVEGKTFQSLCSDCLLLFPFVLC